jgi:hypothetical protein
LECERVSVLVGVKLLQNGVPIVVVKLFPNIEWLFKKEYFTYKFWAFFRQAFLEFIEDGGLAGADIAFDRNKEWHFY